MKRTFVVFLALAAAFALVLTQPLRADSYAIDLTGVNISVDGTLTASPTGTAGVYNITTLTGVFKDTNEGLDINAPVDLYPDAGTPIVRSSVNGPGLSYLSADGSETYDNLLYMPGPPNLDGWGGMLFTADGYEICVAAGDSGNYLAWVSILGDTNAFVDYNESLAGTFTVVETPPVPESSSLVLLAIGLFGLVMIRQGLRRACARS